MMDNAIPFTMTGRDWMIAGRIRSGIREHLARSNAQERQGNSERTQVLPAASPDDNANPRRD